MVYILAADKVASRIVEVHSETLVDENIWVSGDPCTDLAIKVDYAVVRSVEVDYNLVVEYDLLQVEKVKEVADCQKKTHVDVAHQPEIIGKKYSIIC